MMNVDEVMGTEEWQAAASAVCTATSAIPDSAWRTPLSRHLKLAAFLDGAGGAGSRRGSRGSDITKDLVGDDDGGGEDDEEGYTHPLHVAASQNILKLGRMLLSGSAAADPNVRDGTGRTALHWAAMADRTNFVLLLLERGASIDAVDSMSRTPLLSSSSFGALGTVNLLLHCGASVSKASRRGMTPLHGAAAGGHQGVVEALVEAGADVSARTDIGANPRHLAERQGHIEVVRALAASARESRFSSAAEEGGGGGREVISCFWGWGSGGGSGGRRRERSFVQDQQRVFDQHRVSRQSMLRQRTLF